MKPATPALLTMAVKAALGQQINPGFKTQPPATPFYLTAPDPNPIISTIYSIIRTTIYSFPPPSTTSTSVTPPRITTTTTSPASTAAPYTSTTEPAKTPTDACWLTKDCSSILNNLTSCYEQSLHMSLQVPSKVQSAMYAECICPWGGFKQ
ncbi:hypothetical protein NX059_000037 [Plenodomus lindquistii]|nr:hypothetical protein NX059_000037 [Plenodomus lindquistii]